MTAFTLATLYSSSSCGTGLQVLALKCQLASEASRALQKGGQANLQHARGNTPQRSTSLGQEKLRTVGSGSKKDLQPAAQSTYVHQEPSSQSKQHLAQQRDQLFLESKAADDRVPSGLLPTGPNKHEHLHLTYLGPNKDPFVGHVVCAMLNLT